MAADSIPRSPADQLASIHRIAMTFAVILLILPAGCWMLDAAMWFINGAAVAAYGFAMGMAARTSRGFAAGVACAALGLTHPAWVLVTAPATRALGVLPSTPLGQPAAAAQTTLENATAFAATAGVFGLALAICLVSALPLAILTLATAIAVGFLWFQSWLLTWSPLGGLWPSGLSFPAGALHMGIATSLWLCLSRPTATPVARLT